MFRMKDRASSIALLGAGQSRHSDPNSLELTAGAGERVESRRRLLGDASFTFHLQLSCRVWHEASSDMELMTSRV